MQNRPHFLSAWWRIGLKELAIFCATLLAASVLIFLLLNLLPGDITAALLGPNASGQQLTELREQLGLNQPLWERYWHWLTQVGQGTLATSLYTGQDVTATVLSKYGLTLILVSLGMLCAIFLSLPLGMLAAMHHHRKRGVGITILAQMGMAIPAFLLGLALSIIFGIYWPILPANEYVPFSVSPSQWAAHLVLPVLTLGLVQSAILIRYIKNAFVAVLNEDYYRTARAIGWRRWPALFRHGVRNASLELLTVVALQLTTLLTGAIVVEKVFVLPGLGEYLLRMVSNRDLPVVQSVVILLVATVLLVNLGLDLLTAWVDPRVAFRSKEDE